VEGREGIARAVSGEQAHPPQEAPQAFAKAIIGVDR
jgi:hypothetical protein